MNHVYEDGSSLLELCVAADLPAATALLLRHPDTVLPTVATSIKLQMDDSGAVVGDALTPWQRHTIIALARAGRPLAFLNPILIGVLHHSLAATRAAIETLNCSTRSRSACRAAGCRDEGPALTTFSRRCRPTTSAPPSGGAVLRLRHRSDALGQGSNQAQ